MVFEKLHQGCPNCRAVTQGCRRDSECMYPGGYPGTEEFEGDYEFLRECSKLHDNVSLLFGLCSVAEWKVLEKTTFRDAKVTSRKLSELDRRRVRASSEHHTRPQPK